MEAAVDDVAVRLQRRRRLLLVHDADGDADAVVHWRDDRALGPIEPRSAKPGDGRGPIP